MKPGPSGEDSGALPIDTNIIAAATPKRPQHEPINPKAGSSPNQSVAAHPTPVSVSNALAGDSAANTATPKHDKEMARRFLAGLDPNASRFTFQLFSDSAAGRPEIFHGSLDELWPKVLMLNTPQRGVGVFVTISETDFKGRSTNNIVRPRAIFADADGKEQAERSRTVLEGCGASPSMAVNSGRGYHFYFCADVPRDQFSILQEQLSTKLGTDAAVKDLPRVMRLPGTLHLKDPTKPRLVRLLNSPNPHWQFSELVGKLGLSPANPSLNQGPSKTANVTRAKPDPSKFTCADREHLQKVFGLHSEDKLAAGLETNIEEIRSAVSAIPPSAIATEPEWMKLARALAHEAAVFNKVEQLWEILDTASRPAPGYDEADNRSRWLRYIDEALDRENPITIDTVFHMALDNGWKGWSPPTAASPPSSAVWSAADLQFSFSNIPHRKWLYGIDLIRGEITFLAAPGGAGKTALAIGRAIEIATGVEILEEKIYQAHPLKVLFINGEDGGSEIARRIWAFSLAHAHKLAGQNLNRLYVAGTDDARVQRLSFLKTEKNLSTLNPDAFQVLKSALDTFQPDLLVLDPLVAFCGSGDMNASAVVAPVIRELKRLATESNCAVLIIHHTRKGGEKDNAEAISGSAAMVNLARRALMVMPMTESEATKFGVLPSERWRYFKLVDAKSNFAPRSADSPWYLLRSVELPNAEPPVYLFGDSVQAVQRVNLSALQAAPPTADDQKIQDAILDLLDRGKMIDGQSYPYSPSLAGAQNARPVLDDAMRAVAKATAPQQWNSGDLEAVVKHAIKQMKRDDDGRLFEEEITKGRFRNRRALRVNRARISGVGSDGGAPLGDPTVSQEDKGLDKESAALECAPKMSAADRAAARVAAAHRKARFR